MNARIAEELLYESEATLRLVDTLLEELQVMEPNRADDRGQMQSLHLESEPSLEELSELPGLLMSAATQARTVLDGLATSRGVLERSSFESLHAGGDELRQVPTAIEIRDGLERSLLLVDRLDAENSPAPVRDLLRQEILEMLAGVRAQEITEQQLSFASSVLRDTESHLSVLVQFLSPRPTPVIQLPARWSHS